MTDSNPPPDNLDDLLGWVASLDKCDGFQDFLKPYMEKKIKATEDRILGGACPDWTDYKSCCAQIAFGKDILKHIERTRNSCRMDIQKKIKIQGING